MRSLVIAALALTLVGGAQASRPARPAERLAIIHATKIYIDMSSCCAIITRIKVYGVRISTVDRRWAMIHLQGYDETGHAVGAVSAALRKGNLSGRWAVRSFGTSDLGCDMPLRVRRDLDQTC